MGLLLCIGKICRTFRNDLINRKITMTIKAPEQGRLSMNEGEFGEDVRDANGDEMSFANLVARRALVELANAAAPLLEDD